MIFEPTEPTRRTHSSDEIASMFDEADEEWGRLHGDDEGGSVDDGSYSAPLGTPVRIDPDVDRALTLRQDRFTWSQFLALGMTASPGLWGAGVSQEAMAAVAGQTRTAFQDSLRRALAIVEELRHDIHRGRSDRPKKGKTPAPARPWGPPIEGGGHSWEIAIIDYWDKHAHLAPEWRRPTQAKPSWEIETPTESDALDYVYASGESHRTPDPELELDDLEPGDLEPGGIEE